MRNAIFGLLVVIIIVCAFGWISSKGDSRKFATTSYSIGDWFKAEQKIEYNSSAPQKLSDGNTGTTTKFIAPTGAQVTMNIVSADVVTVNRMFQDGDKTIIELTPTKNK